jgi:hypothetical protein
MSFMSYQSTRPWARSLKSKVESREMPPWNADPQYGHFANDRSLSARDIATLAAWVDGGAVEGDPKDAPLPVMFPEGWEIQPDVVLELKPYDIPAAGTLEWMSVVIPTGFAKDTWITSIEIRPGAMEATHHICLGIRKHAPGVEYYTPVWTDIPRDQNGDEILQTAGAPPRRQLTPNGPLPARAGGGGFERGPRLSFGTGNDACYLPGVQAMRFDRTADAAKLVPAGADITLNVHYTPSGKAVTDVTRIGITLAKHEPASRFVTVVPQPTNGTDPKHFRIPANDPNYESSFEGTFMTDAQLVWMMPHMHLRGKDMKYTLIYPDGRNEVVLNVPRFDFEWQLAYDVATPIRVPKGTKIVAVAHHDNSAANKRNPNPNKDVFFGNQTWEEMMNPWFGIVVPTNVDPTKIIKSKADLSGDGG